MTIPGKYEFVSGEKYDEFLKAMGVGMIKRNLANSQKPTMEFIDHGNGKWTQKTLTTLKNIDITFTPGEEFEEVTADDRKSKSLITIDGNTLTHKLKMDDYTATITRVFSDTDMKSTFVCGDKTAHRTFKKVA